MRMGCKYLIGWCRLKEEKSFVLSSLISDKRKLRALAPSGFRKSHTPYRALLAMTKGMMPNFRFSHTKYLGKLRLSLVTSRLESIELSLRALRIQETMVFLGDRLRNRSWDILVV